MQIRKKISRLTAFVCMLAALFLLTSSGSVTADGAVPVSASAKKTEIMLIPGGMVFGVRFFTEGVLVVGIPESSHSPAYAAGIRVNDVILKVGGEKIGDAEALSRAVNSSEGKPIEFVCRRDGREFKANVTPRLEESGYKTGIWVRDSGAGIGTVTFIDQIGRAHV